MTIQSVRIVWRSLKIRRRQVDAEHYFKLGPNDANVTDIVWSFTDTGTSELLQGENVVAEIIDNQLFVYNNYRGNKKRKKTGLLRLGDNPGARGTYELKHTFVDFR